jgi:hypothetical protein
METIESQLYLLDILGKLPFLSRLILEALDMPPKSSGVAVRFTTSIRMEV